MINEIDLFTFCVHFLLYMFKLLSCPLAEKSHDTKRAVVEALQFFIVIALPANLVYRLSWSRSPRGGGRVLNRPTHAAPPPPTPGHSHQLFQGTPKCSQASLETVSPDCPGSASDLEVLSQCAPVRAAGHALRSTI